MFLLNWKAKVKQTPAPPMVLKKVEGSPLGLGLFLNLSTSG
jgi:hypothetical protein